MKIPNKQELEQIAFNHSSNIDFKDFMNLYKKCTAKPYYVLVMDATLASDNPSRFRKNTKTNYKFVLINNVLKEYDKMKKEIKNLKS